MVPLRPYLFGGVAAVALIAAAVAGFLSIAAVSESALQDGIRAVPSPAPDTLNIGGPQRARSPGGRIRKAPSPARDPHRAPDVRSGGPDSGDGRGEPTQGGAPYGAPYPAPRPTPSGDPVGNGGTPSSDAGTGGTPAGHGGGRSSSGAPLGHGSATRPSGGPPPGLANRPAGLPPGLAKKPGGRPPGLAKQDGPPNGPAKRRR
jgi:hypothetical protein